jgi:hypothetical protein
MGGIPFTVNPWPHKSSEDLARAGYKCRGPILCPLCGRELVIYQIPERMPVFLHPLTFQPHLAGAVHADAPAVPIDGKSAAAGEYF